MGKLKWNPNSKPGTHKQEIARTLNFALFRVKGMCPMTLCYHLSKLLPQEEYGELVNSIYNSNQALRVLEALITRISKEHKENNRAERANRKRNS